MRSFDHLNHMNLFYRFEGMDMEETFAHILNAVHEGVVVMDRESTIIYANPAYTRILGVSVEKVLGKKVFDIEPETKALNVLKGKKPIIGEYEAVKSVGKHVIFDSAPIFSGGQMIGTVTIFRDITELIVLNQKLDYYRNYTKKLKKQQLFLKENLSLPFKKIIGDDPAFVRVLQLAEQVAPTNASILLEGESGVGKELLAKAIHQTSKRENKPLISINCAAVPEPLFESELFGYEEGAFTGAKKWGKKGKFELANGGTLFLDEVAELPLSVQAKLLRVLQEGCIDPLGATKSKVVDVRIIAATNKNLNEIVEQGKFRRDLYFRLNVIQIRIPSLRERKEDILLLAQHFLKISEKPYLCFSNEVINVFEKYPWYGNIRELENVVSHAAIVCQDTEIILPHLPPYFHEQLSKSTGYTTENKEITLVKAEKETILQALRKCNNNRSRAMRVLGVSRRTFYKKLKKHGLK